MKLMVLRFSLTFCIFKGVRKCCHELCVVLRGLCTFLSVLECSEVFGGVVIRSEIFTTV